MPAKEKVVIQERDSVMSLKLTFPVVAPLRSVQPDNSLRELLQSNRRNLDQRRRCCLLAAGGGRRQHVEHSFSSNRLAAGRLQIDIASAGKSAGQHVDDHVQLG